ncbi:hypothetical protein OOU_Y34scaffold00584g24 [Pyricularia oryzae Y34]|uniref:Secreted protein n=2 Tax=Pyricularia oryzae TaxID=318829 RepID=A0AA97NWM5_PYRO3|nr:hypothetical protein OOU_Y34scaffold00584g24 [Pyricularia oryzae Y34]
MGGRTWSLSILIGQSLFSFSWCHGPWSEAGLASTRVKTPVETLPTPRKQTGICPSPYYRCSLRILGTSEANHVGWRLPALDIFRLTASNYSTEPEHVRSVRPRSRLTN